MAKELNYIGEMTEFREPTEAEINQLREEYNKHVEEINAMSTEQIEALIKEDKCPYRPELLKYVPLGMHHCPLCGEMVIAAIPHIKQLPPFTEEELAELSEKAGLAEESKIEFNL